MVHRGGGRVRINSQEEARKFYTFESFLLGHTVVEWIVLLPYRKNISSLPGVVVCWLTKVITGPWVLNQQPSGHLLLFSTIEHLNVCEKLRLCSRGRHFKGAGNGIKLICCSRCTCSPCGIHRPTTVFSLDDSVCYCLRTVGA